MIYVRQNLLSQVLEGCFTHEQVQGDLFQLIVR